MCKVFLRLPERVVTIFIFTPYLQCLSIKIKAGFIFFWGGGYFREQSGTRGRKKQDRKWINLTSSAGLKHTRGGPNGLECCSCVHVDRIKEWWRKCLCRVAQNETATVTMVTQQEGSLLNIRYFLGVTSKTVQAGANRWFRPLNMLHQHVYFPECTRTPAPVSWRCCFVLFFISH